VRTCVDRLAGDGGHTVGDEMKWATVQGLHPVQVRDKRGKSLRRYSRSGSAAWWSALQSENKKTIRSCSSP
jgi:hypothetical protein